MESVTCWPVDVHRLRTCALAAEKEVSRFFQGLNEPFPQNCWWRKTWRKIEKMVRSSKDNRREIWHVLQISRIFPAIRKESCHIRVLVCKKYCHLRNEPFQDLNRHTFSAITDASRLGTKTKNQKKAYQRKSCDKKIWVNECEQHCIDMKPNIVFKKKRKRHTLCWAKTGDRESLG